MFPGNVQSGWGGDNGAVLQLCGEAAQPQEDGGHEEGLERGGRDATQWKDVPKVGHGRLQLEIVCRGNNQSNLYRHQARVYSNMIGFWKQLNNFAAKLCVVIKFKAYSIQQIRLKMTYQIEA